MKFYIMIVRKYSLIILLVVALAACSNNSSADKELSSQSSSSVSDTLKDTSTSTVPGINTQNQNSPTIVTGNLNPEHGKPGHRCDLAVGAPLNSKPQAVTQQTQPSPITTSPVTPQKPTTAPGMNPEHGKPGHRCDIEVGTPLSQPVKKIP